MAMLFCKYLSSSLTSPLLHHLRTATFPHITFLKPSLLFTSIAANNETPTRNPQPEISEFLLKDCGLCQSDLPVIFRRNPTLLACRSAHTAREVVKLLRDSGCTEEQVRKIIIEHPTVVCLKTDRQLKPKIELFKTSGITGKDLVNLISKYPRVLGSNLDKTLKPNIQYLQSMWESKDSVSKAFQKASHLLIYSDGPQIWERRMMHLASFGLLKEEIKELVWKNPQVLNISTDKMQKNMDFLIYTAQLPANIILKYPMLLRYSVEGRLKSRLQVLKFRSAVQPSERLPNLADAFQLGNLKFVDKYVKCSPDATKLIEIYSGKSVHLDRTL